MAGTAAVTAAVGLLIEEFTSLVRQYLLEEVARVSSFQENVHSLCDELESIKSLLKDVGGKRSSNSFCTWLEILEDLTDDALLMLEECRAAGKFCKPIFCLNMGRKIEKLNVRIIKTLERAKNIKYVLSLSDVNANSQNERQSSTAIGSMENDNEASTATTNVDQRLNDLGSRYEALRHDLKACFIYFSVFPKNLAIEWENLVHMGIAQGLVSSQVGDEYDVGRSYIQELIALSLLEVSEMGGDGRVKSCKIHDLSQKFFSETLNQHKCFLKSGKQLNRLPVCREFHTISVTNTDIRGINQAIQCPRLRILVLSQNSLLTSISESFFTNLTYLKVLDLSSTAIDSLPKSIRKLKHLKFVNLSGTNISVLPEYLSGLVNLQFLDVSHCSKLSKLHSGIGKHKSMLYLNVGSCGDLKWLPKEILKLGHLRTFKCTLSDAHASKTKALQFRDLKGLTSLQHLSLEIGPEQIINVGKGTFGEMEKMRSLSFKNYSSSTLEPLSDKKVMEHLEVVCLRKCVVPKWIFGLEDLMELELELDNSDDYKGLETTPNLKKLHLLHNDKCSQFPEEFGEREAFPKLEELVIEYFNSLEKFPSLHPEAMPMLKYFRVRWCDKLNLSKSEWVHILKARGIKIKVSPQDQSAIDEIHTKDIAIDGIHTKDIAIV